MLLKLKAMLVKELKQMLRDPKMRMVILVMPVIQLMVMSFALTLDVKNIDIVILDMDKTKLTREAADKLVSSGYFKIKKSVSSQAEIKTILNRGEARGAVYFPANTQERVERGENVKIQVIADGTMSNDAGIIFSYVSGVLNGLNMRLTAEKTGSVINPPADFQMRSLYNENLDSRFYYVPGLVTVMIMVTSILLTSIAIVREKEIGTIEQVMVTPIGKLEFIIGKTLPFFITGYITTTIMLLVAFLVFDIVVHGSIPLLGLAVGMSIFSYLNLALLISASAYTQQQALLTSFFIMMPCTLLSGFMFPVDNIPLNIQYLTYLDPMRWSFETVTGIIIKGAGFNELKMQFGWLAAHALFFTLFASMKFKKSLD